MITVHAFFTVYPLAFLLLAALRGADYRQFPNVVIHRLPIMLERLWQRQCEELGRQPAAETPNGGPFNLVYPWLPLPALQSR